MDYTQLNQRSESSICVGDYKASGDVDTGCSKFPPEIWILSRVCGKPLMTPHWINSLVSPSLVNRPFPLLSFILGAVANLTMSYNCFNCIIHWSCERKSWQRLQLLPCIENLRHGHPHSGCFTWYSSFVFHKAPLRWDLLLSIIILFYRCGNWGRERLNDFPRDNKTTK